MDAFSRLPPNWTQMAKHANAFSCPTCGAGSRDAQEVWINRNSPVYTEEHQRKWQEFYHCQCGTAWWGWNIDRPPLENN
jgi:predicted RNA-binding Zn-ribbon protein involved in translation (DUF1610 family)